MKNASAKISSYLRDNVVLCVAAIAALASMIAVPPGPDYADYIDWRTLGLLFCLMTCVQGLTQAGVFAKTGTLLLRSRTSVRVTALILVGLCFVVSMFVTNDVALITFVPFALYVFTIANRRDAIAVVVVLQTIAANLGSMVTPMGNPQNLFLFTHYTLGFEEMARCVLPFALLSAVLLAICCVALLPHDALTTGSPRPPEDVTRQEQMEKVPNSPRQTRNADIPNAKSQTRRPDASAAAGSDFPSPASVAPPNLPTGIDVCQALIFGALFVLAILCVLNITPLPITLIVVLGVGALANRTAIKKVDYGLLATFVCFFVFSGNLAHIAPVREALTNLMTTAPFAASLIASQVISNVPAATLLAPFTTDWQALMLGVDLGGLGTPVASLASLISLEFFRRAKIENTGRYLAIFTILNVAFLAANILLITAIAAL